ncbi:MAG: hypothetical protein KC646_00675 [Candidatus Cloacimonetes bacterium]|nr:hypothetical protein [Candidatus Cloacimonadota bacterium]
MIVKTLIIICLLLSNCLVFSQVHDNACFFNSNLIQNSHWTKQTMSDATILHCAVLQKMKQSSTHKNPIIQVKLVVPVNKLNSNNTDPLKEAMLHIDRKLQKNIQEYTSAINQDLLTITQKSSQSNNYQNVSHIATLRWYPKQASLDYKKQSEFVLNYHRAHNKAKPNDDKTLDFSFIKNQSYISVKAKEILSPNHSQLINYIYKNFQINTELTISTNEYVAKDMELNSGDNIDNRNDDQSLILMPRGNKDLKLNLRVKTVNFTGNISNQLHLAILDMSSNKVIPIQNQRSVIIDKKTQFFDVTLSSKSKFHQSKNLVFCISNKEMDFLKYADASPKIVEQLLFKEKNLHLKQLIIDSSKSNTQNSVNNFNFAQLLQKIKLSPLDYFIQSTAKSMIKKGDLSNKTLKNHIKQIHLSGLGIVFFDHTIHIKEDL